MRKIRFWVRNYFGFSKTETNGFVILLPLLTAITFFPAAMDLFWPHQPITKHDQLVLDSLYALIPSGSEKPSPVKDTLFAFDPNTASKRDLVALGLSQQVVNNILNYRRKGGTFKVKADFKKIYGLQTNTYKRLKPVLQLPDKISRTKANQNKQQNPVKRPAKQIVKFDINLADTIQLQAIKGIGSVLSSRILNFRDRLGGFVSLEQLSEVYGLQEEALARLVAECYVSNAFQPNRIQINSLTIKELSSHPYISWNLAKALYNYRRQHGNFTSRQNLEQVELVSDSLATKLTPYISWR